MQKFIQSVNTNNLEEARNLNRILKRNIKWCKVLLKKKEEELQQKIKREKERAAGHDSIEFEDDTKIDVMSFASFNQAQSGPGYQIDIKKVEKINQNVFHIVTSKNAFDCLQYVLKTFKEAFKHLSKLTIFVVNRFL